jgi:hypothetical protein
VYTIVEEDSDKDDRLTARDHKTVVIADPDGRNVRRIAEGIDELNMATLTPPTGVTAIFSKGGVLLAATVDIESKTGTIETYEIKSKCVDFRLELTRHFHSNLTRLIVA